MFCATNSIHLTEFYVHNPRQTAFRRHSWIYLIPNTCLTIRAWQCFNRKSKHYLTALTSCSCCPASRAWRSRPEQKTLPLALIMTSLLSSLRAFSSACRSSYSTYTQTQAMPVQLWRHRGDSKQVPPYTTAATQPHSTTLGLPTTLVAVSAINTLK